MDGAGPLVFLRDMVLPVVPARISPHFSSFSSCYGWNHISGRCWREQPGLYHGGAGIVQMIAPDQMTPWNLVMATTTLALLRRVVVVVALQGVFVRGLTETDK